MQTLRLIAPLMSASVSSEPRWPRALTHVFSAARGSSFALLVGGSSLSHFWVNSLFQRNIGLAPIVRGKSSPCLRSAGPRRADSRVFYPDFGSDGHKAE